MAAAILVCKKDENTPCSSVDFPKVSGALGAPGLRAQNGLRAQHVPRSREVLEPLGFKTLPAFLVGVTIAVWVS